MIYIPKDAWMRKEESNKTKENFVKKDIVLSKGCIVWPI